MSAIGNSLIETSATIVMQLIMEYMNTDFETSSILIECK
jgi:hypothetical protein